MDFFGVKLVGLNWIVLHKVLISTLFVAVILLCRHGLIGVHRWVLRRRPNERLSFWVRQLSSLGAAVLIGLSLISIWFDDPVRLATGLGLLSAGLAFALQKVITSLAGYVVIMRGRTFSVGDRITMGGVRGDVISLGFIQTRIMEMGQPHAVQAADPAMWIKGRQYTGRIVIVTNDKIFQDPVYNYTGEFPYLWEEISIPITYAADRRRAEEILLDCAKKCSQDILAESEPAQQQLASKYFIQTDGVMPRVYYRITDNWLELTVRFIVHEHGIREIKDRFNRLILAHFDEAGIGIASATYDIVGFPKLRLESGTVGVREAA